MLKLIRNPFAPRTGKPGRGEVAGDAPMAAVVKRPAKPEWERVLTASLEQNSVAPTDEVILHAFDLYRDDLLAPFQDRRHRMANLHAGISADVALLQALAPSLIERALSRHPFEFAHILEHKETRI